MSFHKVSSYYVFIINLVGLICAIDKYILKVFDENNINEILHRREFENDT